METSEDILRQVLKELQEMNRKLDGLNSEIERITAYGTCDLSDVRNAVETITGNGCDSLSEVCEKLEAIGGKL